MFRPSLAPALALALPLLVACPPGGGGDADIAVDVGSETTLSVRNGNGSVTVSDDAPGDAVLITWTVTSESDGLGHDDVTVTGAASGGNIAVRADPPADSDAVIDLVIQVPTGMDYSLQAFNGDIVVDTALGTGAALTARTDLGGIDVTVPADTGAAVTAVGSTVTFDGLDFVGTNTMGNAAGSIGDGSAAISLEASGDITIAAR